MAKISIPPFRGTESEKYLGRTIPAYRTKKEELINDVSTIAYFLKSKDDTSEYHCETFTDRPDILEVLDRAVEGLKDGKFKIDGFQTDYASKWFREITGDFDPIRDDRRYQMYNDLIKNHDIRMEIGMAIDWGTLLNAARLRQAGAYVKYVNSNFHFGTVGEKLMFSLNRMPKNPELKKISGEPQKGEDMNYLMVITDNPNFVRYARNLHREIYDPARPFNISDEIKKSEEMTEAVKIFESQKSP